MRHYTLKWFLLLSLTKSCLLYAAGPERLLLTTQEWPPYQTYSSDTIAGLSVTRLKCALRQLEQPYQITMTSWENAQLKVQNNEQHGFFVTEQTPLRDKYAVFSAPLIQHHWYWYFSNSLTDIRLSENNKSKWQVSAQFGSNKWFYLHNKTYDVIKKPRNIDTLLDMLMHNEVDAVLVDELAMQVALKKKGMIAGGFRSIKVATKPLGVYFQKKFIARYPEFMKRFNQSVSDCIR